MLIFDKSSHGRVAHTQILPSCDIALDIPQQFMRQQPAKLASVSELQVVRHYSGLSQKNFSIDTNFYPLGSCTMKYNPRASHRLASLSGFLRRHPLAPIAHSQGFLECLFELQNYLQEITGMSGVSLSPMAGAQGEFAGVAMIQAYHEARGESHRDEIIVPDAAHGTNPASAAMCGYKVVEVATKKNGDMDVEALRALIGPKTAGIMLTNPSTLGVFERNIRQIAQMIHEVGGLLYYDGANLNAILGKVRPGDMGFDVMHMNLHKTFATPHGGGGPGSGPVAVSARLVPFLPIPRVTFENGIYRWLTETDCPQTIGRLSAFMGNAGILLRAHSYIRLLGRKGLQRVADIAVLNANYLSKRLSDIGYVIAYPDRLASHEFIITLKKITDQFHVSATDLAKRLLDFGFHAPTIYFPLLVPECLLIEPTETETKQTLDQFVEVMEKIWNEIQTQPEFVQQAPHTTSVRRLDDVKAVKCLDVAWKGE